MGTRRFGVTCVAVVVVAASLIGGLGAPTAGADTTFTVTSTADGADVSPGDGLCATAEATCTLRAAVTEIAKAIETATATTVVGDPAPDPVPTTIVVPAGTYDLSQAPLPVVGAVTITGAGKDSTILDIGTGARGFEVTSGSLALADLTISGGLGSAAGAAGILAQESDLSLSRVAVTGAGADGDGGAIQMIGGDLVIDDSDFTGNAALNGGAVMAAHTAVKITGSRFSDNGSVAGGGAVFLSYPSAVSIDGASFSSNSATADGGAIYLEGATGAGTDDFAISATFENNTAGRRGGALYVRTTSNGVTERTLALSKSTFTTNDAASGGAIAMSDGQLEISDCTFTGNQATRGSGGALTAGGVVSITGSTFESNSATESGGAVNSAAMITVTGSSFSKNSAGSLGGAVALSGTTKPEVSGNTFDTNTATSGGGAIWRADVGLKQSANQFTGNLPAGDDVKLAVYEATVSKAQSSTTAADGDGSSSSSMVKIGAAAAGVVVIVLLGFLVIGRRRRRARDHRVDQTMGSDVT